MVQNLLSKEEQEQILQEYEEKYGKITYKVDGKVVSAKEYPVEDRIIMTDIEQYKKWKDGREGTTRCNG